MTIFNDSFEINNNELFDKLIGLAKQTILNDIKENFTSKFLLPEATKGIIDSYLENNPKLFQYENRDAILVTLLLEVISSGYTNAHYNGYSEDILQYVIQEFR